MHQWRLGWTAVRSRFRDGMAALLGVVLAILASAQVVSVQADNFGGPKNSPPHECNTTDPDLSQCVAATYWHEVNFNSSVTAAWETAFTNTASTYDSQSDMRIDVNVPYASWNDVRIALVTESMTNWGWTRCASTATSGSRPGPVPSYAEGLDWCRPQLIYINLSHDDIYNTSTERLALACHELGHTMGLRHRDTTSASSGLSCMKSVPRSLNPEVWYSAPEPHEIGHLNHFYP